MFRVVEDLPISMNLPLVAALVVTTDSQIVCFLISSGYLSKFCDFSVTKPICYQLSYPGLNAHYVFTGQFNTEVHGTLTDAI